MSNPLVSVIIIFFNAEQFLAEAIDSVLAQTYAHWELLLVDDGSSDASRAIAIRYVTMRPGQIKLLAHPGSKNRGMAAARNLGIRQAQGDYVAFLDADDLWLNNKLAEQVTIMASHRDVAMLYGETRYWFSWSEKPADQVRDHVPDLRVPLETPITPPELLPLFLRGKAAVPCTCSILIRREALQATGGFEESFVAVGNLYEDQAFYAKVVLQAPVMAVARCWDWYRQHPQASTALAAGAGLETTARLFFLQWLERYLQQEKIRDVSVWQALRREQWRLGQPAWLPATGPVSRRLRWLKKWALRAEEQLLPDHLSHMLWKRGIE